MTKKANINYSRHSAFWVTPKMKVVEVEETHIKAVINNPRIFGITKGEIERIYRKHNETLGDEGKARDEIVKMLLKKGFIRLRFDKTSHSLELQKY